MFNISDELRAALKAGGREPLLRLEVLAEGEVIESTEALGGDDLYVLDGSTTVDGRAVHRRRTSCSLVDVDGSLVPIASTDLLNPVSGNELRVWYGFRLPSGTVEWVPLITAGLEKADLTDTSKALSITLAGSDRSKAVADNAWRQPYTIAEGENVGDALMALLTDRLTGVGPLTFNFVPTDAETPRVVFGPDGGGHPWTDAQGLALGAGLELLLDPLGAPTLRQLPDPTTAALSWEYLEGDENLLVDPVHRSIDRTTLRNGVVVVAEAPWLLVPVRGEAWQETGPLARSVIGEHPEKVRNATVGSTAAANAAAAALLPSLLGVEEQVRWSAVTNPAHDALDVIDAEADAFGGVARLVIETLAVPYAVDETMNGTTRRRSTA